MMAEVHLPTDEINDWTSFHLICKQVFGFPDFYGMNLDAWVDCLSDLDEDYRMCRFLLDSNEVLTIDVDNSAEFKRRLPDVFEAMIESAAFVNERYVNDGKLPKLVLELG